MKQHRRVILWAYGVELLLSGILYALAILLFSSKKIVGIMLENWSLFSTIAGILFAAGIAMLIYVFQFLNSDFGKYLSYKKVDQNYLHSYQMQAILFFIAIGLPVVSFFLKSSLIAHLSWLAAIYAIVNGLTNIRNTVELVKLQQRFILEFERIKAQMSEMEK